MKHILSLFILTFGTFALACPPGARICVPVQHNNRVAIVPAVITHHAAVVNVQTILVPVATYTASYSACEDNSSLKAELQGLKQELKVLREAIAAANINTPPPLPPGATPSNPPPDIKEFESKKGFVFDEKILVSGLTKCSNCHQPATKEKGGGFVMFDEKGNNLDFLEKTPIIHKKIVDLVASNKMPKGKVTLTKEEKEQILDFYKSEEKQ